MVPLTMSVISQLILESMLYITCFYATHKIIEQEMQHNRLKGPSSQGLFSAFLLKAEGNANEKCRMHKEKTRVESLPAGAALRKEEV